MALSRITLTFNEDLTVNDFVSFFRTNIAFPLFNTELKETWQTTRTDAFEIPINPPTGFAGVKSAEDYATYFDIDTISSLIVSRNQNVVSIVHPLDTFEFNTFTTNANVTAVIDTVSDDTGSTVISNPILLPINSKDKFFFADSPINFNFQNELSDSNIQKVDVQVFIWRGFQQAELPTIPALVFNNVNKISPQDNYIALELHNEIKSYITSSNLNKNNPQYAYNTTENSTTAGEGVYFQIVYKVDNESVKQLGTFFATTGYRYDFEQKGGYYNSYIENGTVRKYAKHIRYDKHEFNLTTDVATSHSGSGANGMIVKSEVTPAVRETQTGVSCLIAYVNKQGLWDTFTPFGKFIETIDTKRDEFSNSYRNPLNVNAQIQHLKSQGAAMSVRKFSINTGLISESNNYQIQEIIQSSKIYLIIFQDVLYTTEDVGITVDSTDVTVDDTTITADNAVVTLSDIGFYSNLIQIPVINKNSTFVRKTRLNDKSSISYNLEFEGTNNYINDIL